MANEVATLKSQEGIVEYARGYVLSNNIILGKGYNLPVAMNNMWLTLLASNEKNKCLEKCSELSIRKAVEDCINKELDTGKTQGYFIPYGNELQFQSSYFGEIKRARDVANVNINSWVIYEGEQVDIETRVDGSLIVRHKPSFKCFGNPIIGAYAIATDVSSGRVINSDIMGLKELKVSLAKSKAGGTVAKEFPHEMYRRTVSKRLAKHIVNTSDDSLKLTITDTDGKVITISNSDDVYSFDEYTINTDEQIAKESAKYEPTEADIVTAKDLKLDAIQSEVVDIPENAVEISYGEYKNNKEKYTMVSGSYNPSTKTCLVIVNE